MKRKRLAPILLALVLTLAPGAAAADDDPNAGMKVLDVVLVRPLAMLVSLVSTGVHLGTSPFTTMMGIEQEAARYLVVAPWRYTSAREIGSFTRYRDGGDIVENLDLEQRRVRF